MLLQIAVEQFEVQREVLDAAFAEFDVRVTQLFRDDRRVPPRHREHFIRHVHADDAALRADGLGGDEANFSGATARSRTVSPGFT